MHGGAQQRKEVYDKLETVRMRTCSMQNNKHSRKQRFRQGCAMSRRRGWSTDQTLTRSASRAETSVTPPAVALFGSMASNVSSLMMCSALSAHVPCTPHEA